MKLGDNLLETLVLQMREDRRAEVKLRLIERGKLAGADPLRVEASVDRIFEMAREADILDPHECARLVELFYLLPPRAYRSPTCAEIIHDVLDHVLIPASMRVDFLYRHVLGRTDWPEE